MAFFFRFSEYSFHETLLDTEVAERGPPHCIQAGILRPPFTSAKCSWRGFLLTVRRSECYAHEELCIDGPSVSTQFACSKSAHDFDATSTKRRLTCCACIEMAFSEDSFTKCLKICHGHSQNLNLTV